MKVQTVIAFGLVTIAALPAAAASINVSASAAGAQFDTTQAGASDFANSGNLGGYSGGPFVTPAATISGGQLNPGGSTNPDSGINNSIASYIAAGSSSSITIAFKTPESYFGLLWGSVDATNTIAFYDGAALIATFNGSQIGASAYPADGSYVNFTSASSAAVFNKIVLSDSSSNFFEVDNLATKTAPVPLPASAYLMLTGLGLLFVSTRKRKLAI